MKEIDLREELESYTPDINDILRISGAPSLSIGAFHNGRILYTKHFGHQDSATEEPPNDDSIYHIASLSKLIAICAIGALVQDGLLEWDLPVHHYLPGLKRRTDDMGTKSTLRDLAANRSGLPAGNLYWGLMKGDRLLQKKDFVSLVVGMKAARPFRDSFVYSIWNYCLIQLIAEKVTGKPFGQIMKENILEPLRLCRSTFEIPEGENVMVPHAVRDDGTVVGNIPVDTFDSEQGLSAVAGGKMSLQDILTLYSALLFAYEHQMREGTDDTPGSPFAQLREIFAAHIPFFKDTAASQQYCLGAYRTVLPGNLSCASYNSFLLQNKMPIFRKGCPGAVVYHHTGNKAGFFSSMFLVPETQSGVVCFTNATPLMDPTDLCAQIYLSVLLRSKLDLELFRGASAYLEKKKSIKPPTLPLSAYAGVYVNDSKNFLIHVKVNVSVTGLQVSIQNSALTTYDLLQWSGDTFYWKIDREEEVCEKGMFPVPLAVMHLMGFSVVGRSVKSLSWRHEMLWKDPEIFKRFDGNHLGRL